MRTLTLIALLTLAITTSAVVQSAGTAGDSSKMSTSTPAATVDDESFNGYQRVTPDMKPPKATRSPDPDFPEIPSDAEPRGVVVMLIGVLLLLPMRFVNHSEG